MHELYGYVLGVRDAAAGSERQQTAPAGESTSHFLTRPRQPVSLTFKKLPGYLIAVAQLTRQLVSKWIHR
jgi:hypothetical protein